MFNVEFDLPGRCHYCNGKATSMRVYDGLFRIRIRLYCDKHRLEYMPRGL